MSFDIDKCNERKNKFSLLKSFSGTQRRFAPGIDFAHVCELNFSIFQMWFFFLSACVFFSRDEWKYSNVMFFAFFFFYFSILMKWLHKITINQNSCVSVLLVCMSRHPVAIFSIQQLNNDTMHTWQMQYCTESMRLARRKE